MLLEFPYDLETIERTLGNAARKRAGNKRRGGDSAARGFRFEIGVCVRLLLGIAAKHARMGSTFTNDTIFWEQPLGFVDDLMIREGAKFDFYQFKTGTRIGWYQDRAALRRDFRRQLRLMDELGLAGRAVLMVDNEEERASLLYQQKGFVHPVEHMSALPLPQQAWYDSVLRSNVRTLLGDSPVAERIFEPSLVYNFCRAFKSAWDDVDGRGSLPKLMGKASISLNGLVSAEAQSVPANVLSVASTTIEAEMGQIGRCLVVHNDDIGDTVLISFRSIEELSAFLTLLSDAPGGITVDDLYECKAWFDEQLHAN